MTRVVVRKVFVTGLVVAVAGAVVLALSIQEGAGTTSRRYEVGTLLAGFGALITVVSWVMALAASAVHRRWGWFAVVLILGLIGLLLPIMVVYSVIGPSRPRHRRGSSDEAPADHAPEGDRRLTPA